jgi:hypothetical protein
MIRLIISVMLLFCLVGQQLSYRVFHFEVSISAPRLDIGSKSQQIITFAQARSIWDFQPLGAKARAMLVDFCDALAVERVR